MGSMVELGIKRDLCENGCWLISVRTSP